MDEIRIGLDFGTHQTKICIQRTPDEGHGVPEYEFFKFHDLNGKEQYFLPSVVQVDKDDTLSYGYVDPDLKKESSPDDEQSDYSSIDEEAEALYTKYSDEKSSGIESKSALVAMINKKHEIDEELHQKSMTDDQDFSIKHDDNLFRYFKQATFAEYPWKGKYESNMLCVWYLAYVLFLLEDKFPDGFGVNMGVPTDDKTFAQKRELATCILVSAIHLVENEYNNDITLFLNAKVDELLKKTIIPPFSEEEKEDCRINIFPEAYASLIGLTSRGKLTEGMSLNADIGGGTTDVSFFIVHKGVLQIYKYWSIPCGLNYIADRSGFDYSEGDFELKAHSDIVDKYNKKKEDLAYDLVKELVAQLRKYSNIPKSNLHKALSNRIVVYNGGGSIYPSLATSIYHFSDIKTANSDLWTEEIIRDKSKVVKLANLLTTAFGLSVCDLDSDVVLCDFDTLFAGYRKDSSNERQEIDKDVC